MPRRTKKTKRGRAVRAGRRQRAGARRLVFLFLTVLIALLYAGPVRSYHAKRELVERQSAQVEQLRVERQALEKKLDWASTRAAAERAARELYYIKPGEHLYVVHGIDRWLKNRESARK